MTASRVLAGGEALELLPLVDIGVVGVSGQLVVPSGSAQLSLVITVYIIYDVQSIAIRPLY